MIPKLKHVVYSYYHISYSQVKSFCQSYGISQTPSPTLCDIKPLCNPHRLEWRSWSSTLERPRVEPVLTRKNEMFGGKLWKANILSLKTRPFLPCLLQMVYVTKWFYWTIQFPKGSTSKTNQPKEVHKNGKHGVKKHWLDHLVEHKCYTKKTKERLKFKSKKKSSKEAFKVCSLFLICFSIFFGELSSKKSSKT